VAIGERLREARMRQKIDIAEVESATKIRAKYLRALENEEFGLLPGNTFVKTFMRTYADYLGLDAQLLIEEYRVDYEPRDQVELQPYMSPPRRRRQEERRRPRAPRGPPGPGTAVLVVVGVVLVIFAILGLTAGGDNNGPGSTTTPKTAKNKAKKPSKPKPAPKPKPTTVKLRVVPVSPTYLCVDRGLGTPIVYQGTTSDVQTFRGKHLRMNIGNATTVKVTSNRKRVRLPATATIVGYDFRPGRAKPLPAGEKRPCT
jgi:cytoskeleton protein RodZ